MSKKNTMSQKEEGVSEHLSEWQKQTKNILKEGSGRSRSKQKELEEEEVKRS